MTSTEQPRRTWQQRLGGGLFLITGAGLVVHLLIGLPLWLTVFGGVVIAASLYLMVGNAADPTLQARIRTGLACGAVATVCYDATRTLYVVATHASVHPFDTWRLFGLALVGPGAPPWAVWSAGTAFHLNNGLLFAVAYTIWLGERGPLWGVGFALVLETFMLGLFPGWLHLRALGEFTQMSMLGHVAYGAVLGFLARRMIRSGGLRVAS
jgi:hypothetical protein